MNPLAKFLMGFLLICSPAFAEQPVRIATWNVLDVGEPGSQGYEAAYDVLARIGANIVAVQEVASDSDATYLVNLAVDLGYPNVTVAPGGPFGSDRTAIMADFPMQPGVSWTSAALSGDPAANDITRYILEAEVDVSGAGDWLSVIVTHWKSGSTNTDEYRRAIESTRISQVVHNIENEAQPYIVLGDVNQDIRDGALTPNIFTSIPADLPASFVTGADIQDLLINAGLRNDPFAPITSGATMLDAKQVDGNYATRPESGRRLDYMFVNDRMTVQGTQVYECADEGISGSLPLEGEPLPATTCPLASDHLPVFADLDVASDLLPTITINDVTKKEGHQRRTPFTFAVTLSAPRTEIVSVKYATANDSAIAGSDYVAKGPTLLTFSPGQTVKKVTITVKGDRTMEANETFFVELSTPTGATLADAKGQGTILNDD